MKVKAEKKAAGIMKAVVGLKSIQDRPRGKMER